MTTGKAEETPAETSFDGPPPAPPGERRGLMRRMYDWVLYLSKRPTAERVLWTLAFAESMFFPIPPDVMLLPMCVATPRRAFRFATGCSLGSLLGGMGGYAIGLFFWAAVSGFFFQYIPGVTPESFGHVQELYEEYNFWVVFAAGFSPIPYKLITISAGVFEVDFAIFLIASAVSRSARFFLVAAIVRKWGAPAQEMIEKRFNLFALLFVVLLVGGFMVLKLL